MMPQQEDKEFFENRLISYLTTLNMKFNESEEHQKNIIKDFLKDTAFPNNYVNTNDRADLAIFNGQNPDSTVGILIETKSTTNNSEMMTAQKINSKAFQEIISYYLKERIVNKNIELKKVIITNGLSWFIIDSNQMEKYFYTTKLTKQYNQWRNNQLSSNTTDFLYSEVVSPQIDRAIENNIEIAHFDLTDAIKKSNQASSIQMRKANITQLYRFFTAENLLNKQIFTDPNKLNNKFYDELLYLMGLEEHVIDKKKVIRRLPKDKRQLGSLIENILDRLTFSDLDEEKKLDNAIQLSVIWINRILFLKLLESQLVSINMDEEFYFINKTKIKSFDDLYDLFFGVLARKAENRTPEMQAKYPNVPYLNSSLFEEANLERSPNSIGIDQVKDRKISFYNQTELKNNNGKRKIGEVNYLEYMFEFLDSYDFSTSIVNKEKNSNKLINSSVLGLVFEKINGYKEGSYFTPGKITMYMSKELVRTTIVNKVNEIKDWNLSDIHDLKMRIRNIEQAKEINSIINNTKICDPAVGSGHFLVSVLNEIISLKSYLNVLFDTNGRILSEIQCTVVNDELIIQDMNGDNYEYIRNSHNTYIQQAIFNEKRTIIENSLFGVDLNPNSVNICRLRLWIELLKSSYYNDNSKLTTLPNIDINIKQGDSLIHNIPIDSDFLKEKKKDVNFQEYSDAVRKYKETSDRKVKKEIEKKIIDIKTTLFSSFDSPELRRLGEIQRRITKVGQGSLFETTKDLNQQTKELNKLKKEFNLAEKELEERNQKAKLSNGLEWRIEFPEILDQDGTFVGFDAIIANPPYIYSTDENFSETQKKFFNNNYPLNNYQSNTYGLFMELSIKLMKNNGVASFIIPNTFLTIGQYDEFRKHILKNTGQMNIINSKDTIFEDADVDNCIVSFSLAESDTVELSELIDGEINLVDQVSAKTLYNSSVINISAYKKSESDINILDVLQKMEVNSDSLFPNYADVKGGLKAYQRGKGRPVQPLDKEIFKKFKAENPFFSFEKESGNHKKFLDGKDINRYKLSWKNKYIEYSKKLAEPRNPQLFESERILIRRIPATSEYSLTATYTNEEYVHEQSIESINNIVGSPFYLLGVLNSKPLSFYLNNSYL